MTAWKAGDFLSVICLLVSHSWNIRCNICKNSFGSTGRVDAIREGIIGAGLITIAELALTTSTTTTTSSLELVVVEA